MRKLLKAFSVKARLINALFMHAILTEHGKTKIGYLTAIIKPLGQIIMLSLVFTVLGRSIAIGDSMVLFLALGIIPYNLCIGLTNKMLNVNKASSRMLLSSTPATPFDISIAFLLSESLVLFISTGIILTGLGAFGYWDYRVDSLLGVLLASIASIMLGFSVGLLNISIASIIPSYEKVWKILSAPLFLTSGVIFVADRRFPPEIIAVLQYNPLLHIIESMRDSFYRTWESTLFDLSYVLWFILYALAIGLGMQKITQNRERI
jgi:capsular polysaccharide transport system permease protein